MLWIVVVLVVGGIAWQLLRAVARGTPIPVAMSQSNVLERIVVEERVASDFAPPPIVVTAPVVFELPKVRKPRAERNPPPRRDGTLAALPARAALPPLAASAALRPLAPFPARTPLVPPHGKES